MLLTYEDVVKVFRQFKTEDAAEQEIINSICLLTSSEIDDFVWGETARAGTLYLIACRLSCGAIEQAKATMSQAAVGLLQKHQQLSQQNNETNSLENWDKLPIASISINDEATITFSKPEELGQTAISEIMKTINSSNNKSPEDSNFYCQQYKQLRDLVVGSPLYSGDLW
ncbi:MAG TPA: hypothetical protein VIQ31_33890 [Phormidium sp.]